MESSALAKLTCETTKVKRYEENGLEIVEETEIQGNSAADSELTKIQEEEGITVRETPAMMQYLLRLIKNRIVALYSL